MLDATRWRQLESAWARWFATMPEVADSPIFFSLFAAGWVSGEGSGMQNARAAMRSASKEHQA